MNKLEDVLQLVADVHNDLENMKKENKLYEVVEFENNFNELIGKLSLLQKEIKDARES